MVRFLFIMIDRINSVKVEGEFLISISVRNITVWKLDTKVIVSMFTKHRSSFINKEISARDCSEF